MKRRAFITFLGGVALTNSLAARAQQPAMPVVGLLYGVSAAGWLDRIAGFRRGLSDMGYVEGRNVTIDYRWADGQFDRLPAMATDLVARKVAVILSGGSDVATREAMAATQSIPIVFTTPSDPVELGFVASLNRPGRNVTGVTFLSRELGPKRLELLHELLPAAKKIAVLINSNSPVEAQVDIQNAQTAARSLGLEIIVISAGTENEIASAFAMAVQQRAAALSYNEAFLNTRRAQIAALALRYALPTLSSAREAVVAGQLMSYGSNVADSYRQAGRYVGRVLKGEKPADLPVMQPTKFELVINLKTAKAIGVQVPDIVRFRADEVIE